MLWLVTLFTKRKGPLEIGRKPICRYKHIGIVKLLQLNSGSQNTIGASVT